MFGYACTNYYFAIYSCRPRVRKSGLLQWRLMSGPPSVGMCGSLVNKITWANLTRLIRRLLKMTQSTPGTIYFVFFNSSRFFPILMIVTVKEQRSIEFHIFSIHFPYATTDHRKFARNKGPKIYTNTLTIQSRAKFSSALLVLLLYLDRVLAQNYSSLKYLLKNTSKVFTVLNELLKK